MNRRSFGFALTLAVTLFGMLFGTLVGVAGPGGLAAAAPLAGPVLGPLLQAGSLPWFNITNKPAPYSAARLANTLTAVDTAGDVGQQVAITLGADELGLMVQRDSLGHLKATHCTDAACTSATSSVVDATSTVGGFPSVGIQRDGLPLISYYDGINDDLKVVHCADVACTTTAPIITADSGGDVGQFTSATIAPDGLATVSYYDVTNGDLKVIHCMNLDCSSFTRATVSSAGDVGRFSSITIAGNGRPLISYYSLDSQSLTVAHCADSLCGSATIASVDNGAADVGQAAAITTGADGLGLISYFDATNGDLKVAHCNNVACSSATLAALDTAGVVGQFVTSVAIGADGLGLISYFDATKSDLKVAHCKDLACSGATFLTLDSAGLVGFSSSTTIGTDGLPLIAYQDASNLDLKVAHCGSPFCVSNFRRR